jgi:formiminotetrahydrofolate cyclodeaminase
MQKLVDLSLSSFASSLAERTATPGGGSLAAFMVAAGSATASMAFRFTSGQKYAAVEEAMARRARVLDELRERALELVDRDAAAYDAVSAGYALAKSSDQEKAARKSAIQAALKGALAVPLETMEVAAQGLGLLAEAAGEINRNVASDCTTGALALWAGMEGASLNVQVNALSIEDPSFVQPSLRRCDGLLETARRDFALARRKASELMA